MKWVVAQRVTDDQIGSAAGGSIRHGDEHVVAARDVVGLAVRGADGGRRGAADGDVAEELIAFVVAVKASRGLIQNASIERDVADGIEVVALHQATVEDDLRHPARCGSRSGEDVVAGEVIGTGNTVPNQFALDMGMRVNGVAVCPLDYFEPTIKQELENRL